MAEEYAHVVAHRPWEHADLIINGGEAVQYDRNTEVVVAEPPRVSRQSDLKVR
jgi:hypothetical protein